MNCRLEVSQPSCQRAGPVFMHVCRYGVCEKLRTPPVVCGFFRVAQMPEAVPFEYTLGTPIAVSIAEVTR